MNFLKLNYLERPELQTRLLGAQVWSMALEIYNQW